MKRLLLTVLCLTMVLQSMSCAASAEDNADLAAESSADEINVLTAESSADKFDVLTAENGTCGISVLTAENTDPTLTLTNPKTVFLANDCNTAGEYGFLGTENVNAVKGFDTEKGSVLKLSALSGGAFGSAEYEIGSVTDVWDGSTRDVNWFGDGTAESYEINSAAELAGLSKLVADGNSLEGKRFTLKCSVDLDNKEWTPIGGANSKFKGSFDGDGNEIKNLKITKSYGGGNIGVFGYVEGSVSNLGVSGADVSVTSTGTGKITMAALVGYMTGEIENCYVKDASLRLNRSDDKEASRVLDLIAPVAGALGKGTKMTACYSADIYIYSSWGSLTGGIFGLSFGETSAKTAVNNCYTGGSCTVETNPKTGNAVRYYPIGAKNTSANTSGSKNMCGHTTALFKGDRETYGNVYTELAANTVAGEMLKQSAAELGSAYGTDIYYINGGLPVLKSQRTPIDMSVNIAFDINVPQNAEAELVLYSGTGEAAAVSLGALSGGEWKSVEAAVKDGKFKLMSDGAEQREESLPDGLETVSSFKIRVWGDSVLLDNIMIYKDESETLEQKAESLKASIMAQAADFPRISDDLILPDGEDGCTITWKSAKPEMLSDSGNIRERKNCSIPAAMTAEIKLPYPDGRYEAASAELVFPFRIAPNDGASNEETVDDILNVLLNGSGITDEPWDKISKNLAALPSEWDGAQITWSTSDAETMESDGTVHIRENETGRVTLTAEVTLGEVSARRELEFTVLSAAVMLSEAADAVTYEVLTDEAWQKITKDLTLPDEGAYGARITWSSDCPNLLTDRGYVMEIEDDTAVTLTALFEIAGYTVTKEFPFVVRLSASKKIEVDMADIEIPREVKADFSVPQTGSVYESAISWSSSSPYLVTDGAAVRVTRPENEVGNVDATITAAFENGGTTVSREYTVTVICLPPNEEFLQEILDGIGFADISYETDLTAIKQSLHLTEDFGYGIGAVWSSDKTEVVSNDGMVTRPTIGSSDEAVVLTLTLTRGTAVRSKEFRFTVAAYGTPDELLNEAAQQLTFRKLSAEPIDLVSEDLFLPKAWSYGTEISWQSDSEFITVEDDGAGNYAGRVKRPEFASENRAVTLKATISCGSLTLEKEFLVTVAEKNGSVAVVYEDFNSFAEGETFTESVDGKTTHKNKNQITTVAADPEDSSNMVLKIEKTTELPWVSSGSDATVNSLIPTLSRSGDFSVKFRLFIEKMSNLRFRITAPFVGEGLEEIDIFIEADGTVYQKNTGNKASRKLNIGSWNDISIVFSTYSNTLDIYLGDDCILRGAPFAYSTGSTEVSAIKLKLVPPVGSSDGTARDTHTVYIDDLSILRMVDYSSDLAEAMKQLELGFLAAQNIGAITKNIVIPDLSKYGVTVSASSSDTQTVENDGTVHRGSEDREVAYTVTVKNEYGGSRSRTFKLLVKKANYISDDEDGTTDEAIAVLYDAQQAIKLLESKYNFGYITGNITLPTVGINGSTLTWKSMNTAVLTDSGTVTRQSADTKVTLYLTATLGNVSERIETELTVKALPKGSDGTQGGGGSGGGGGGGASVISPYVPTEERGDNPSEPQSGVPFKDVEGHWAKEYILKLHEMGIVNGVSSTEFGTEATVTREEFVTMLTRLLGCEYDGNGGQTLADVSADDWFYPYVMAAYEAGIVGGVTETRFGAGENISRQDLCVMIERVLKRLGVSAEAEESGFADEDSISDYAKSAVHSLKKLGIIGGRENNMFDPFGEATRAEAAKIISGLTGYMNTADSGINGRGE